MPLNLGLSGAGSGSGPGEGTDYSRFSGTILSNGQPVDRRHLGAGSCVSSLRTGHDRPGHAGGDRRGAARALDRQPLRHHRARRPQGAVRGGRFPQQPRAPDAFRLARGRRPRLPRRDHRGGLGSLSRSLLARPGYRCNGDAGGRQGTAARGACGLSAARGAAVGARAQAGSRARSISACAPSTPSSPAAAASAWASSRARASASRLCCR